MGLFVEHDRQSLRLPMYDYSAEGAYFVTICTYEREELFGKIHNGRMGLNEWGRIVQTTWAELPSHFSSIALDEFVIMPNHVHGIIEISKSNSAFELNQVGAIHELPLPTIKSSIPENEKYRILRRKMLIPKIIGYFKMNTAKCIHTIRQNALPVWQRNYYDHIIRSDRELFAIREYIANNPIKWGEDVEHAERILKRVSVR